jgi:hypothetical protein
MKTQSIGVGVFEQISDRVNLCFEVYGIPPFRQEESERMGTALVQEQAVRDLGCRLESSGADGMAMV